MSNFSILLTGELQRIKKYNILAASLVVLAIWVGVLHFSGVEDISRVFPLLILLDATSMAIIMIGVTIFFEKQEGVLKTLLVSPISKAEYLLAKIVANSILNLKTLFILYVYAIFFKEIFINIFLLVFAVILVSVFHSLIGLVLTFYSKDFTGLLLNMMKYFFVLLLPVLLVEVGMITNETFKAVLYGVPTKASMLLINSSVGGVETWEIVVSTLYLAIASWALFAFVGKRFQEFANKESGL